MSAPAHRIEYAYADYLALERTSNVRHEFLGGQIYAMAGGTPEHAALAATIIGLLFPQLRNGPCRIHDADLRVRVRESGLTTYPDVTVVCGARELDSEDPHAITNPRLVVEVLSPSTEMYDRGDKLEHYKQLESLRQIVLVASRGRAIEVWSRDAELGWSRTAVGPGEIAQLTSIEATLDVDEVYDAAAGP